MGKYLYISILFLLVTSNVNSADLCDGIEDEHLLNKCRLYTVESCHPGLEALQRNDYVAAIKKWGEISPDYSLQERYFAVNSCLVRTKVGKIFDLTDWYILASENGAIEAEIMLAASYYREESYEDENPKYQKTWYWSLKALSHGNTGAKEIISWLFLSGEGTEKDLELGMKLLKEAAEDGSFDASNDLIGIYRFENYGQKKDDPELKHWCDISKKLAEKYNSVFKNERYCNSL